MSAHKNIGSVTMPAGEYFVGDPCYSVPNDRWMEWLEAADYMNASSPRYLLANLDGHPVLGIGTAYGDGTYLDEQGNLYPVDAGLIGLVPVEIGKNDTVDPVRTVVFDSPFECSFEEDGGTIVLGNIRIETDPDNEDDQY